VAYKNGVYLGLSDNITETTRCRHAETGKTTNKMGV
jgi:hypothetical protein